MHQVQMSTLQNHGADVSVSPRQDLPSLYDETVVRRLSQCFTFYNEDDFLEQYSKMEREDLEKVTAVKISGPSTQSEDDLDYDSEDDLEEKVTTVVISKRTQSEDIHLLQALPNLEEVILTGDFNDKNLAAVLV